MDHEHLLIFSESILVIVDSEDIEFLVVATLQPFGLGTKPAVLFCDILALFLGASMIIVSWSDEDGWAFEGSCLENEDYSYCSEG